MSWVRALTGDLKLMREQVHCVKHLPCPVECPGVWWSLMSSDRAEWSRLVSLIHFSDSVCDRQKGEDTLAGEHVCSQCRPATNFHSRQALLQHMRMKHGLRNPARLYVDACAICPGCGINFRQRLRAIAHLSDARRPACMNRMLKGEFCKVGPPEYIEKLDSADRVSRRNAKREGHTTPLARGSAITKDGKKIGFAKL